MSDGREFRLLIIADIHYGPEPTPGPRPLPQHKPHLGLALARRAIADTARQGGFDCILLMGDQVDDARGADTEQRLIEIRDAVAAEAPGVPLLVACGNHDPAPEKVFGIFRTHAGPHEVNGYRFVVVVDSYTESGALIRPPDQQQLLRDVAARPGGPIIVLQHYPINLLGQYAPMFMVANYRDVMRDYASCGVLLAIGAHCHVGQGLNEADGVMYLTMPCLCVEPFPYAVLTVRGRNVSVEMRHARYPAPPPAAK